MREYGDRREKGRGNDERKERRKEANEGISDKIMRIRKGDTKQMILYENE